MQTLVNSVSLEKEEIENYKNAFHELQNACTESLQMLHNILNLGKDCGQIIERVRVYTELRSTMESELEPSVSAKNRRKQRVWLKRYEKVFNTTLMDCEHALNTLRGNFPFTVELPLFL